MLESYTPKTPFQILIAIIFVIATCELIIMAAFALLPPVNPWMGSIIDVVTLVSSAAPIIYLWIIEPWIKQEQSARQQLEMLANCDPLTMLPNRRQATDYLEKHLSSIKRHQEFSAVLYIDIDDFKIYNDIYGHQTGDLLLQAIARRLKDNLRTEDLVARLGGDEFIVIFNDLGPNARMASEHAFGKANKLNAALKQPFRADNEEYKISASIGVRIISAEDMEVTQILKDADSAMYKAKYHHKGQVHLFRNNF